MKGDKDVGLHVELEYEYFVLHDIFEYEYVGLHVGDGALDGIELVEGTGLEQAPTPWHDSSEIVPKVTPAHALTPMQLEDWISVSPFVKEQL
jgi:hypothetical protein